MTLTAAVAYGWWIGFGVGAIVVIIVGVLVLFIIATADQIASLARDGTTSLAQSRDRTEVLWRVEQTNEVANDILDGAKQARKALGG